MKNFKIIISFALCVALILCVSITAFAKGAGQGNRNATMTTAYENFDLYYSHTHHYVPYGTIVGRIVYYPASGDTTPKATYVRFIQGGLFSYSEYYEFSNMNPCRNGNTIDGIFGQVTEDCVEAFQYHCGLSPDGVVGNDTWGKLEDCVNAIN